MAGISVGCGLSTQCRAIRALQAELLAVGRQQQFDRRGVEADAVVQRHHLVALVDAADRDHRLEDLDVADVARVAGEQRLQEERPVRGDHEVDPVARDVDARKVFRVVDDLVDLHDHHAVVEGRRLGDGRGVLGVRAGVQVAVAVGRRRRTAAPRPGPGRRTSARTARRRCGSRRSARCRPRPSARCARSAGRRRPDRAWSAMPRSNRSRCSGRDTDEISMCRSCEALRVAVGQRARQEVGLLLVVALQGDAVARPDHVVQQVLQLCRA